MHNTVLLSRSTELNSRSLEPEIPASMCSCPTVLLSGSVALSSESSAELDNFDFLLIAARAGAQYYGRVLNCRSSWNVWARIRFNRYGRMQSQDHRPSVNWGGIGILFSFKYKSMMQNTGHGEPDR